MVSVLNDKDDEPVGLAALQRLAQKLELKTAGAIRQENRALQEMMWEKESELDDGYESETYFPKLFSVFRKLTSILPAVDGEDSDTPELDRVNIAAGVFTPKAGPKHDEVRAGPGSEKRALYVNEMSVGEKGGPLAMPDDFKCPISLEMMKDPVIVATGQVSFPTRFCSSSFQVEQQKVADTLIMHLVMHIGFYTVVWPGKFLDQTAA